MAINPISLRSAYSQAAQSIEKKELDKKPTASSTSTPTTIGNYTRSALVASNAPSESNSAAAVVTRSEAPTQTSKPKPSDALVDDFDYAVVKKDTTELEGYARRYLAVIQDPTPPGQIDKKVEGLVAFYGGNPEREQRFKNFVGELEAGQQASAPQQTSEVAIA